jgi:hypothetical protein
LPGRSKSRGERRSNGRICLVEVMVGLDWSIGLLPSRSFLIFWEVTQVHAVQSAQRP